MQKNQNAEIQQRVINLVELYRTKVGKESQIAKDAKAFYDSWQEMNKKTVQDGYLIQYSDIESPETEKWINNFMVNEQLLGHFYAEVVGENADKEILGDLLPDVYVKTVFSKEEESFMKTHFKEMVNYIMQTPCDEDLKWVNRDDERDAYVIPNEILELIKSRVEIPAGSVIYNPLTAFAQFTNLFSGCKFYCTGTSSWTKLAIYANNVDAEFIGSELPPSPYDAVVLFLQNIPDEEDPNNAENRFVRAYNNLKDGGKMVLICPNRLLRQKSINKDDIVEIIQFPEVMSSNAYNPYSLIIAEKGRKDRVTTMIDARFAYNESGNNNFSKVFDADAFNSMIQNKGCDVETGLQKKVYVPSSQILDGLLIPQVYVIERPSDNEHPIPLSSVCELITERVRDVKFNLPLDTPLVFTSNLSKTFVGALKISSLKKVGFPNNPSNMNIHDIDDDRRKIPFVFMEGTASYEEQRIAIYRSSTYIDGQKDAVLLTLNEDGVKTAFLRSPGKPISIVASLFGYDIIYAFYPRNDFDALSLLAIFNMPIVYRQMQAYEDLGLSKHLDDILVPTDKRIIRDEIQRLYNEQEAYEKQEELLSAKKTEYINEVRMRKHDMGQYVFEMMNIEDLMRYYLDNRNTEKDFCQQIESLLDNFRSSLGELSTLLDNLSKEEQFGDPESFNMTEFMSSLEKRHTKDSYKIQYTCDMPSIKRYNKKKEQAELDAINDQMMEEDMKRQAELDAIADQMMMEDMKRQAELDAIADQMMEEDMKRQAELDAINDQMMEEDMKRQMKEQAELDAIADQMMQEDLKQQMKEQAELDAINDQMMREDLKRQMKEQAELDAINDQMMREDLKQQADAEVPLTMSSVIGRDNGISANANMYMPPIYVAPNDFQRLVNNILNNAKRHGFTNPNKKDYVVQINASIDAESGMYQIDFRNNGDPLPEGMNKTRYGLKGEKAGKTAGTGLGGNYVKSFVEHYGGDYDIFMEDGWTVVRICLPLK